MVNIFSLDLRRHYSTILIVFGVLVLSYPLLTEVYGFYVQNQLKASWSREAARQKRIAEQQKSLQMKLLGQQAFKNENAVLRQALPKTRSNAGGSNFPLTRIIIPKINLNQVVVSGVDPQSLKNGPGYYPGSPNPGEKGNLAIAGHRVTYTHPFYRLDELEPGDKIILETIQVSYEYKVVAKKILDPKDISMLQPTDDARLTLTTCNPRYSAKQRLDVQAVLSSKKIRQRPTIAKRLTAKVVSKPNYNLTYSAKSFKKIALETIKAEINDYPNSSKARIKLGLLYEQLGNLNMAEQAYQKAVALNQNSYLAHFYLAKFEIRKKNYNQAIIELNKAIQLNPDYEPALFELGRRYLSIHQYQLAVEVLQKATNLAPLSADDHYYLGLAYEKIGQYDLALKEYVEVLKYVPDYNKARLKLRRITIKIEESSQQRTTTESY